MGKEKQIDENEQSEVIPAGDYQVILHQFTNQARRDEFVAIIVGNKEEHLNGKGIRMRLTT